VIGKVSEIARGRNGLGNGHLAGVELASGSLDFTGDVIDAVSGIHGDGEMRYNFGT